MTGDGTYVIIDGIIRMKHAEPTYNAAEIDAKFAELYSKLEEKEREDESMTAEYMSLFRHENDTTKRVIYRVNGKAVTEYVITLYDLEYTDELDNPAFVFTKTSGQLANILQASEIVSVNGTLDVEKDAGGSTFHTYFPITGTGDIQAYTLPVEPRMFSVNSGSGQIFALLHDAGYTKPVSQKLIVTLVVKEK